MKTKIKTPNGIMAHQPMKAKPMKTLELHFPVIQFTIIKNYWMKFL